MKPIKTEIKTLIARNMFLPQKDKLEILASNEEKQHKILPLLRGIDKKQIILFRKVLKAKPNFFDELGDVIIENRQSVQQ